MSEYTWGVDGYGRAHLTEDCEAILLCGLNGVNGYLLRDYYEDHNMAKGNITINVKATETKKVKDLLFLLDKYQAELPAPLLNKVHDLVQGKPTERDRMLSIVKAVSHIGVDFGYGKFYLQEEHIKEARSIYENNRHD